MLRALLVDDEAPAIRSLETLLRMGCPDVEVVGTARSGVDAATLVAGLRPDVVFLDVEMPRGSGFEFLERVSGLNFHVIFVTAHSLYAVRAFKHSAVDYLLKPVDMADLRNAVEKVRRIKQCCPSTRTRHAALLDNLREIIPRKWVVSCGDATRWVELPSVITVATTAAGVILTMADGSAVCAKPHGPCSDTLGDHPWFAEFDAGQWVNLAHIHRVVRGGAGTLVMSNGQEIPLAPGRKERLIDRLTEFNRL